MKALDLDALVPVAQMAELLMVTQQHLALLQRDGKIPKSGSPGAVVMRVLVQGYIKWIKDENARASKSGSQSRVQQARAQEIELRIARDEGLLVEMEKLFAIFAETFGSLRSELAGVAAASTRDPELRIVIEGHINDAVERLRTRFEARARELEGSADSTDEPDENEDS